MNEPVPTLIEAKGDLPLNARSSYKTEVGNALVAQFATAQSGLSVASTAKSSTPFYNLGSDTEIFNPRVAQMKEAAHKLVGTGLVSDEQLKDFSVRLSHTTTPTPASDLAKEAAYAQTSAAMNKITELEFTGLATPQESYAADKNINLDEPQIKSNFQATKDPVMMVFLHELGHATREGSWNSLLSELRQNIPDSMLSQSGEGFSRSKVAEGVLGEAAKHAEAPGPQKSKEDWTSGVKESQADVFAIVAIQALQGKEAALDTLDKLVLIRDQKNAEALTQQFGQSGFMEGHHTTESLLILRDKITGGEVAKALEHGEADKLVAATVIDGITKEYENVALAKLNPHTLKDGELRPGLPEGVTMRDVLDSDLKKFNENGGTATIFVESKDASKMEAGNLQVLGTSSTTFESTPLQDASLDKLGDKGYKVLAVAGDSSVEVSDTQTGTLSTQQIQPAVNTLLMNYGFIKEEESRAQQQQSTQTSTSPQRTAEREL